jgi:hypothetical protein
MYGTCRISAVTRIPYLQTLKWEICILETVNGELNLPTVEMLNAQVYEFGVELFFEKTTTRSYSVNILSHTEIFRNDVYLAAKENGHSSIDRTAESNKEYTYNARTTHPPGQAGDFTIELMVNTSPSFSNEKTHLQPNI